MKHKIMNKYWHNVIFLLKLQSVSIIYVLRTLYPQISNPSIYRGKLEPVLERVR